MTRRRTIGPVGLDLMDSLCGRSGWMTSATLAQDTGRTVVQVRRALAILMRHGFVRRIKSERRSGRSPGHPPYRWSPTAEGRARLKAARRLGREPGVPARISGAKTLGYKRV